MEITRNGKTERLVLVELIKWHSSVAGRATTCWKAYYDRDESKIIHVIKDSWQYPEPGEEGELLRDASEKKVVNVARYYHHETVRVGGEEDDINDNIRKGHESLRNLAGIIQSDVSIGNLMMNEDEDNPSWRSFLIDLGLAIQEDRVKSSGAPNKTGTRAFMAIGALYGEKHSFMHDLESFFWVLFWICIHYNGPNKESRIVPEFEKWNYEETGKLAKLKTGTIARDEDFIKTIEENFTLYYRPSIPWANRLRKVVFPGGGRWKKEDQGLYFQMGTVLEKARSDPEVSAE
ncbi:MAG: hypothetical protein M1839_002114 [Geoglossum umbratile]|nr:MAG: hypothetical protein M1839_002114 [Geoglossum umbratile]